MRNDILKGFLLLVILIVALQACGTEGVKLEPTDRAMIDTLIKRETMVMATQMDKWCTDSTPIIRQKMIDSLLIVREQEIIQKTTAIPNGSPQQF